MAYTAKYPATIPDATDIYDKADDVDFVKTEDFEGLREELHAVMVTLGVEPQKTYDSLTDLLAVANPELAQVSMSYPWPEIAELSSMASDTSWHDIDLSSLVPVGTLYATLYITFEASELANKLDISVSGGSETDHYNQLLNKVANTYFEFLPFVKVSSDRKISYRRNTISDWTTLSVNLVTAYI